MAIERAKDPTVLAFMFKDERSAIVVARWTIVRLNNPPRQHRMYSRFRRQKHIDADVNRPPPSGNMVGPAKRFTAVNQPRFAIATKNRTTVRARRLHHRIELLLIGFGAIGAQMHVCGRKIEDVGLR